MRIDALIWISATNRASVLSGYVQASAAAFGIEPVGTAESVAARLLSWLSATDQPWLVVLDDLQDPNDLDGLWPEGSAGRVLVTGKQSSLVAGRRGDAGRPGRLLQRPRGPQLPDRAAQREPGPASGRH